MPQLFRPRSNSLAKLSIAGVVLLAGAIVIVAYTVDRGAWVTVVQVTEQQPIPFSHKHHVGDDGIDCRYCHTSVETSAYAGMPATEICMSCHSQLWSDASVLEPLRESWQYGRSIEWTRIYDLPDFVYFNHSIHIAKGIGCSTCHGRVDQMPLTYRANALYMNWCLQCHRNPERYVRPRDQVFNSAYVPPTDQLQMGKRLVAEYQIHSLTDCVTCHR